MGNKSAKPTTTSAETAAPPTSVAVAARKPATANPASLPSIPAHMPIAQQQEGSIFLSSKQNVPSSTGISDKSETAQVNYEFLPSGDLAHKQGATLQARPGDGNTTKGVYFIRSVGDEKVQRQIAELQRDAANGHRSSSALESRQSNSSAFQSGSNFGGISPTSYRSNGSEM
jgi:hypothetical protein